MEELRQLQQNTSHLNEVRVGLFETQLEQQKQQQELYLAEIITLKGVAALQQQKLQEPQQQQQVALEEELVRVREEGREEGVRLEGVFVEVLTEMEEAWRGKVRGLEVAIKEMRKEKEGGP